MRVSLRRTFTPTAATAICTVERCRIQRTLWTGVATSATWTAATSASTALVSRSTGFTKLSRPTTYARKRTHAPLALTPTCLISLISASVRVVCRVWKASLTRVLKTCAVLGCQRVWPQAWLTRIIARRTRVCLEAIWCWHIRVWNRRVRTGVHVWPRWALTRMGILSRRLNACAQRELLVSPVRV